MVLGTGALGEYGELTNDYACGNDNLPLPPAAVRPPLPHRPCCCALLHRLPPRLLFRRLRLAPTSRVCHRPPRPTRAHALLVCVA